MAYFISGEKQNVVYCSNYRVASTSTSATIMSAGGIKLGDHHASPPDYTKVNDIEIIPSRCLVVETVRHHCDVMVSWWMWRSSSVPFPDFVKSILDGKHGALSPTAFYDKFQTNYILRYETLAFEWETLCLNAGLPKCKLKSPVTKRPKSMKWNLLFSHDLLKAVYNRYEDEMERLGYGPNQPR